MVQEGGFKPSVSAPQQGGTPLVKFSGVLQTWDAVDRTDNDSRRTYKVISFKFVEVEVIESEEPYPYPVAEVRIGYAPPEQSYGGSRWEAFSHSLRKLVPENPDIDVLVGKRQTWSRAETFNIRQRIDNPEYDPADENSKKQIWVDVAQPCWQVVDIEGIAKPENLMPYIIGLANGKTEQEFNQALLADPKIISRADIVSQITNRELLPALLTTNQITRDAEGVLHAPTA